jgi:MFS family permease
MRVYYGWVIVGVGIVVSCIGVGTMMSLTVFLQPVSAEMGWSRAGISAASMLASFAWMFSRSGRGRPLRHRRGAGRGLLLDWAAPPASWAVELWHPGAVRDSGRQCRRQRLYAAHRDDHELVHPAPQPRGRPGLGGLGIGAVTVAPLATWMIVEHGWRTAMLVLGGVAWAVVLPAALLLRRPPAQPDEARPAAGGGAALSVAQALRTPQFAAVALTYFACCAAHSGPIFHMVSYALACGIAPLTATTVFSAAGLGGLVGRIGCGLIADRVGAKPVLVVGLGAQALAILLYTVVSDLASLYTLSALFGVAYGGVMPLYAILIRQYFGARIMGATFGAATMASTLGMAIGPLTGGWIFDAFAAYHWLYVGSFAIGLGAVAIALTFRPPRLPSAPALSAV